MKEEKFEFLEHTADIKFRVLGKNLNEVFENSALAISNYISKGKKVKENKKKIIEIEGTDYESLFYQFLDEIIYLLDADNFVVASASVTIEGNKISAIFLGDDSKGYNLDHVKAATYAEMYIKPIKEKGKIVSWEAQAVLDV